MHADSKPVPLHVAVAAVFNAAGQVLLARRPAQVHQGGLWEFPGGKVEPGETVEEALVRELQEELGIRAGARRPLIQVVHDYPDRSVLLDVWRVDQFSGVARGREGQPLQWAAPEALPGVPFPAANLPIVTAVRLPTRYMVSGEPVRGPSAFLAQLERSLESGIRLVQLRAKSLGTSEFEALARSALALVHRYHGRLLLNAAPALVEVLDADGVHLTRARLLALGERPLPRGFWVGASCHDAAAIAHARHIQADFVVVSPVLSTPTHSQATPIGWVGLRRLAAAANFPVYALGGMEEGHLSQAFENGAQGIAGIGALWGRGAPAP